MTQRRTADFFLRSNPRTAAAVDRFIGGGRKTRPVSKRHQVHLEIGDGGIMGGVTKVLDYSDSPMDPFETGGPQPGENDRKWGRLHAAKTSKNRESGYIGKSPVFVTHHKEERLGIHAEQNVFDGTDMREKTNKMAGATTINVNAENAFCKNQKCKANAQNKRFSEAVVRNDGDWEAAYAEEAYPHICSVCYAGNLEKGKDPVIARYTENANLFSDGILPVDQIPKFNPGEIVRFDSFGDIINDNHFINIMNIVRENPQSYFVIWSKNFQPFNDFIHRMGHDKPANLTIIFSNSNVDQVTVDPLMHGPMQGYVDGTFNNVYKKDAQQLTYADIKNLARFYPDADPATPIEYGYDSTLDLTFIYCDEYCGRCKGCYSGKTRFVAIEGYRINRGKDDLKKMYNLDVSKRRRGTVIAARRTGLVPPRSRRGRQPARGPARRSVQAPPRFRMPGMVIRR